ncbi:hypothetical protein IQ268_28055 [Oculatella sp. LEGE 06141]|uniref:hypothetical protein n=1 Tax=Oculatella sp. LEGE 06141 TaxID=1828648 RepID=UPI001880F8F9|nr:hypothetical protein [Oculatella sp. LEGE 06141]MBE9182406.1 hypothetical protein [Oculatella sp. LEGE 06141]
MDEKNLLGNDLSSLPDNAGETAFSRYPGEENPQEGRGLKPSLFRWWRSADNGKMFPIWITGLTILAIPFLRGMMTPEAAVPDPIETPIETAEFQVETVEDSPIARAKQELLTELGAGEEAALQTLAIGYLESADRLLEETGGTVEYKGKTYRFRPERWLQNQLNDRSFELKSLDQGQIRWDAGSARKYAAIAFEIKALQIAIESTQNGEVPRVAPSIATERIQYAVETYRGMVKNSE